MAQSTATMHAGVHCAGNEQLLILQFAQVKRLTFCNNILHVLNESCRKDFFSFLICLVEILHFFGLFWLTIVQ